MIPFFIQISYIVLRYQLIRNKQKTKIDKIELSIISKVIKIKRKKRRVRQEKELSEEILEGNKNMKSLKKKLSSGLPVITFMENKEGAKCYNRVEINDIATNYYKSLYRHEKVKTPTNIFQNEPREPVEEPEILVREVEIIVENLKRKKALGIEKITNEQLKNGGPNLIKLSTILFNKILKSSKIPIEWKHSEIILIPKKGNIGTPNKKLQNN